MIQPGRRGSGIENSEGDLLPELCREAGDAQVDHRVAIMDAYATVLRLLPFGDVELGKNFTAGDQRLHHPLRKLKGFLQHAIDAVADAYLGRAVLDVNIAGTGANTVEQDQVE